MDVDQDYNVSNYVHPRTKNNVKSQDRTIVAGSGVKRAPIFFITWNGKDKFGKEPPTCIDHG